METTETRVARNSDSNSNSNSNSDDALSMNPTFLYSEEFQVALNDTTDTSRRGQQPPVTTTRTTKQRSSSMGSDDANGDMSPCKNKSNLTSTCTNKAMQRSWSMLEMHEMEVIHDLQDDMETILSLSEEEAAPRSFMNSLVEDENEQDDDSSSDDFMFYDDDDEEESQLEELPTPSTMTMTRDDSLQPITEEGAAGHGGKKEKKRKGIFKKLGMKKSVSMGIFATSSGSSGMSIDATQHRVHGSLLDAPSSKQATSSGSSGMSIDATQHRVHPSLLDAPSSKQSMDQSTHRVVDLSSSSETEITAGRHQLTRKAPSLEKITAGRHQLTRKAPSQEKITASRHQLTKKLPQSPNSEDDLSSSPNSAADYVPEEDEKSNDPRFTSGSLWSAQPKRDDDSKPMNSSSSSLTAAFRHSPKKKPAQSILRKANSMLDFQQPQDQKIWSAQPKRDDDSKPLNSSQPSLTSAFRHCPKKKPAQSILRKTNSMLDFQQPQHQKMEQTKTSSSSMKRTTSFSTLEIREYHITIGDNPGGRNGPPISLDWDYCEKSTVRVKIDEYEEMRPPRRARHEMYMSGSIRMWTLMKELGYSLRDIESAAKEADSVRKKRHKSIKYSNVHNLKYKVAKALRIG